MLLPLCATVGAAHHGWQELHSPPVTLGEIRQDGKSKNLRTPHRPVNMGGLVVVGGGGGVGRPVRHCLLPTGLNGGQQEISLADCGRRREHFSQRKRFALREGVKCKFYSFLCAHKYAGFYTVQRC